MSKEEKSKDKKKTSKARKPIVVLLLNILAMVVISILLIVLSLQFLKRYTRHNDVVLVPDIKGLTEEQANKVLAEKDLMLNITDSVYNAQEERGVVLDFTPMAGSKIKRNRYIFATINTKQVAMKKMPRVYEVSMRQAEALLMSNGFVNVTIKYVGGAFRDLAQRVTDENGREFKEGEMVPYNTPLILEVTSDKPQYFEDDLNGYTDTTEIEDGVLDEDFF